MNHLCALQVGMAYAPLGGCAGFDVRIVQAVITAPLSSVDRPLEFTHGMMLRIELTADLSYVKAPKALSLQVEHYL
jgi:hypothetical protein